MKKYLKNVYDAGSTIAFHYTILYSLYSGFDRYYIGQIYGGDFAKIFGLLRIYEL